MPRWGDTRGASPFSENKGKRDGKRTLYGGALGREGLQSGCKVIKLINEKNDYITHENQENPIRHLRTAQIVSFSQPENKRLMSPFA